MFALVDCNNFYASCERVFRPDFRNVPIVVLSNNDGCVIARSNEAKQLGIPMGVPAYQIKDEVRKYGIQVFSSNYTLYGDMSNRVMTILSSFTPNIEIYSIDEAFLDMNGFEQLGVYGKHIVDTTTRWTGIPVSMGIASTKTLAKVANKFAKKYKAYQGVCLIDTEEKRVKALQMTDIGDVWGIGRRSEKKLRQEGICTAYEFTQHSRAWVRKTMTVTGERTWSELQGESCIDLELVRPEKKQICTSRAFGKTITELEDMKEAVAYYAALCAEKLREQKSFACALMVFIHTNNFREDLPQYFRNYVIQMPVPTCSTMEITKYALEALAMIFKPGFQYKKAGVIITEIAPDDGRQMFLFDTVANREKQERLMRVVDGLNRGFTRNVLNLAVQGLDKKWNLRRELLSPCYTTDLREVIQIK